jgi:hypothetical protein
MPSPDYALFRALERDQICSKIGKYRHLGRFTSSLPLAPLPAALQGLIRRIVACIWNAIPSGGLVLFKEIPQGRAQRRFSKDRCWKNRALMGFTPIVDARKQIVGLLMRHERNIKGRFKVKVKT